MPDTLRALVAAQVAGVRSLAVGELDFDEPQRAAIARAYRAGWEAMPEHIQVACEVSFYVGQRKGRGGDGQGILCTWSMESDEAGWWREAREQREPYDNP